ncbi:uncharacterized protein LOC120265042 [Dioscorea cayenensis subsp. rotundata]|uniref:Uncharacterized protein LOC120265042 n=1 Tax=Dioscorea cayennensis subsp. rotundata TaxID=55577 RepID=A0AB40BNA4_DIOCR|nr:uncharacterized protein LOC120265042 [Dioscorea cayenensis subsp. rotundata]
MASNEYQWSSKRNKPVKEAGIYEIDSFTTLAAQVDTISKRLDKMQVQPQNPFSTYQSLKVDSLISDKELVSPVAEEHENESVKHQEVIIEDKSLDGDVGKDEKGQRKDKPSMPKYQPKLPYLAKKDHQEEQFKKFLDLFKTLHINVPFVEALAQMPHYAKFIKEFLTNKRKLEDVATITLSEECSAIISNKTSKKEKIQEVSSSLKQLGE